MNSRGTAGAGGTAANRGWRQNLNRRKPTAASRSANAPPPPPVPIAGASVTSIQMSTISSDTGSESGGPVDRRHVHNASAKTLPPTSAGSAMDLRGVVEVTSNSTHKSTNNNGPSSTTKPQQSSPSRAYHKGQRSGSPGATSPNFPGQAVVSEVLSEPEEGEEQLATDSTLNILAEWLYLLVVGEALRPEDPSYLVLRKCHAVLGALLMGLGCVAMSVAIASVAPSSTAAYLLLGGAAVYGALCLTLFIAVRRTKSLPDKAWALAAALSTPPLFMPLVANPGRGILPALFGFVPFLLDTSGSLRAVMSFVTTVAVSLWSYNSVALANGYPVAGVTDLESVLINYMGVLDPLAFVAFALFTQMYATHHAKMRRRHAKETEHLAMSLDALLRFHSGDADQALAAYQEQNSLGTTTHTFLESIATAVHRYRPHVPHYVLDAGATALPLANTVETVPPAPATQAFGESVAGAGDSMSYRSSRHHRRSDLRGRSFRRGMDGSTTRDPDDTGSNVSRYTAAQSDTGSIRSFRSRRPSDSGSNHSVRHQASPLYLARARPVLQRKVTIAHMEYFVPPEFCAPHAFELLVDALLARASEYDAAVHTIVGDVAIVSWNATKSVQRAEQLACQFAGELMRYVRKQLPKDFTPAGATLPGAAAAGVRLARSLNDMSISTSNPSLPRIAGAIMTGEARVCFAGSKSYEFCLSYPQWQGVLVEMRKYAATRGTLCIDASTRAASGGKVKARATEAISIVKRLQPTAATRHGAYSSIVDGVLVPVVPASEAPSMSTGSGNDKGRPLVELARSPHNSNPPPDGNMHSIDDPNGNGGSTTENFDIIVYEVVNVQGKVAPPQLDLMNGNGLAVNCNMSIHSVGMYGTTPRMPNAAASYDAEEDETPLGILGIASASSFNHGSSGGGGGSGAMNHRLGGARNGGGGARSGYTSKIDDPDDLITRGVHAAALERRYDEAARRFREAAEVLRDRIQANHEARCAAQAAEHPRSPRIRSSTTPLHGTSALIDEMFNPPELAEYCSDPGGCDSDTPEDPGKVGTEGPDALLTIVNGLLARAVRCSENPNRLFGCTTVTLNTG